MLTSLKIASRSLINTGTIVAVAAAAFTMTATAHADTVGDVAPIAALSIAGVDFTSPAAVHTLKTRVYRAAREVCFHGAGDNGLPTSDERACYSQAVSTALATIDAKAELALRQTNRTIALAH